LIETVGDDRDLDAADLVAIEAGACRPAGGAAARRLEIAPPPISVPTVAAP